jgi:hypothetical protein
VLKRTPSKRKARELAEHLRSEHPDYDLTLRHSP